MRYQVPQFTDVEDKIVGPLTLKQFIYLAGGAGICIALFYVIPFHFIAIMLMVPVAVLAAALAFYKVNNREFINVVESFVKYFVTSKLYIWKHETKKQVNDTYGRGAVGAYLPKLSDSKLRDLTWTLDVKENVNPVTRDMNKEMQEINKA